MIRTYKRKLILSNSQSKRIDSWIGTCRLIYNLGMEIKNSAYHSRQEYVSKYDLCKQLPELKKDYEWIQDVPSQSLQLVLRRLEESYQNFFKKNKGFPKFATKKKQNSIHFRQDLFFHKNMVRIPKMGLVRMFKDSEIKGELKNITIIKEPTGYFICFQCENVPKKFVSENQTVGLDMGISHFCIDSNGVFTLNPKHSKKYEKRLRIENRSLSRKLKGSNSRLRQVKKLSLLHLKIKNSRKDFLHKESTKIAKCNSVVCLEDLKISSLCKSSKISQKILDCGWGMFGKMLEYKTSVIKVPPKYTSQICNECGCIDSKSRISQSIFCCTSCGHISNADVNAAKNILCKGIALSREREPLGCALALESKLDMSALKPSSIKG